jgi:hypothetical protein
LGFGVGVLGFWVWGFGQNPQSPIPNPQSPIPNPHLIYINNFKNKLKIKLDIYSANYYIFLQIKDNDLY